MFGEVPLVDHDALHIDTCFSFQKFHQNIVYLTRKRYGSMDQPEGYDQVLEVFKMAMKGHFHPSPFFILIKLQPFFMSSWVETNVPCTLSCNSNIRGNGLGLETVISLSFR